MIQSILFIMRSLCAKIDQLKKYNHYSKITELDNVANTLKLLNSITNNQSRVIDNSLRILLGLSVYRSSVANFSFLSTEKFKYYSNQNLTAQLSFPIHSKPSFKIWKNTKTKTPAVFKITSSPSTNAKNTNAKNTKNDPSLGRYSKFSTPR